MMPSIEFCRIAQREPDLSHTLYLYAVLYGFKRVRFVKLFALKRNLEGWFK